MSEEVTRAIIEKFLELRDSYKKKKCFNDDDLPQLRNALKDIPQFKDIAAGIRNETLAFYDLYELKQNEMLVKKDNPNVSIYILVQGSLKKSVHAPWNSYKEEEDRQTQDLITLRQNFQEFEGLYAFGNFDLLQLDKFKKQTSKWNSCFVYSTSQSLVLALNYDKAYKYMEKLYENQQIQDKTQFLMKNVPGLQNQLTSNREKMTQLFHKVSFIPNQTIIQEGQIPQMAYIIIEGHCKLQSNQIPIQKSMSTDDPKKAENFVTQNRGYFSKTMNTFQIGIISENQWIGEELLLMTMQERYEYLQQQVNNQEEQPNSTMTKSQWGFNIGRQNQSPQLSNAKQKTQKSTVGISYSVISKTNVTAYCISKEDLMTKLSKDIQLLINKQALKKQEWVQRRFRDIQIDVKKIFGMEQSYQNYVDKSKEVSKLYPQATKNSIKTFSVHKMNEPIVFLKDGIDDNPTEKYYNKGFLNTQTMNFSKVRKSQSVASLKPLSNEEYEDEGEAPYKLGHKLNLPQIMESDEQVVSHSEVMKFHNNPFEASLTPIKSKLKDSRSTRNLEQLSVTDKITQQLNHNNSGIGAQDQTHRHHQKFERIVMGSASVYKYTQQNKLYLPTLIKTIEFDKKMQIVNRVNNQNNLNRLSLESLHRGSVSKNTSTINLSNLGFYEGIETDMKKKKIIQFEEQDYIKRNDSNQLEE
eukprot:403342844